MKDRVKWFALAIAGAVFLFAGYWIGTTKYFGPLRSMHESQNWHDAICTIISSKAEVIPGDEDVGDRFKIHLTYEFPTGDKIYRSKQYNFQENEIENGKKMRQLVETYSPGAKCLVFYNPNNPLQSVIERKAHIRLIDLIMACVFALIGAATLFSSLRNILS